MAALFATTLFLSAFLLFWIQPLVAKMVLPLLGGTPSVWNTCVAVFQTLLLAGYGYTHCLTQIKSIRRQFIIHSSLLLLAAITLPIKISPWLLGLLPSISNPVIWLTTCLLFCCGLPFFALSTHGPLLQRWFAGTEHPAAGDPYFLYASSNIGSLSSLLLFPLAIEPMFTLPWQSVGWTVGFVVLVVLVGSCGIASIMLQSSPMQMETLVRSAPDASDQTTDTLRPVDRCIWVLLAFIPSSLMLGVTTYLTTDIASIPLLWILPLAVYLWTFVLNFSKGGQKHSVWSGRALPFTVLGLSYLLLSESTRPIWLIIVLHLFAFFVVAMTCHSRLSARRPSPRYLTEFYLWISVGGVLGGWFNAFFAPLVFTRVWEYPIALLLACWLRERSNPASKSNRQRGLDWALPLLLGIASFVLIKSIEGINALSVQVRLGFGFGLPLLGCFAMVDRSRRFALGLAAVWFAAAGHTNSHGAVLFSSRNFFGILRVTRDPIGPFYRLVHGNTLHGRQSYDPEFRHEPLSYYHPSGPLGQVFQAFRSRFREKPNVGVVGLGIGSIAAYAEPSQNWTFYEINPAVVKVAYDTNYFTYLSDCAAGKPQIILGDARLRLQEAPASHFNLLILDAFSSDSIPVHLMTREAVRLYMEKTAPDGLIVFHISNRSLELQGILADLAHDAGLICLSHDEVDPRLYEVAAGKDQSHWVVLARRPDHVGRLIRDSRWLPIRSPNNPRVWTDDFSNLISVFKWD